MKKIQLLVLAVFVLLLTSTANLNANNAPDAKRVAAAHKELKTEVVNLMQNPKLKDFGIEKEAVTISFKMNAQNEVEILNVKSDNAYLKNFVTKKLNHQQLVIDGIKQETTYNLKIEFILE